MRKRTVVAALVFAACLVGAAAYPFVIVPPLVTERSQRMKSADDIRSMLLLYHDAVGLERPWPAFSGKRFVLWLVAKEIIDKRNPKNLEILFSWGDAARSLEKAGGAAAYEKVTIESLRTGTVDVRPLTSYAGPRVAPSGPLLSPDSSERPLIADLSFDDGAVVGFSNGAARWIPREELGVPPGVPIVVGPSSPSPLLRQLSDE